MILSPATGRVPPLLKGLFAVGRGLRLRAPEMESCVTLIRSITDEYPIIINLLIYIYIYICLYMLIYAYNIDIRSHAMDWI